MPPLLARPSPRRRRERLALPALLLPALVLPALAAAPAAVSPAHDAPAAPAAPAAPVPAPGVLADPVAVAAAAEQSYALYLPSSYAPEPKWPLVFLFDAQGRGAELAERFRPAAEAGGFVLAASNTVADNTPWDVNQRAVRLLLADVFRHAAVDERRLSFAGSAGTARLAWAAATGFGDAVAGALLLGGTTPGGDLPDRAPPFPVFLAVGREAFNYQEVRRLDAKLEELGARHRLAVYAGGDARPPEATAAEGLRWIELESFASGRAAQDDARLHELLDADLAAARRLGEEGEVLEAWERWRALERSWAGLAAREAGTVEAGTVEPGELARRAAQAVAEARREAERLEGSEAFAQARQAEERAAAAEAVYRNRLAAALRRLLRDRRPPQPARLVADLEVPSLLDRAENAADPTDARAARRMLERAFAHLVTDAAPRLLAAREFRRAAAALTAAAAIHGDRPEVWLDLARALARAGEPRQAREALSEAAAHGFDGWESLADDEVLGPLVQGGPGDSAGEKVAP